MNELELHIRIQEGSVFRYLDLLHDEVEKIKVLIPEISNGDFEYDSGYVSCREYFWIRCAWCGSVKRVCGDKIRRWRRGAPFNIHCSGCKEIDRIISMPKKICPNCGVEFKSYNRVYCSKECNYEYQQLRAHKERVNAFVSERKVCKYCGKIFMTQFKKSKNYCSDECMRSHQSFIKHCKYKNRYNNKIDDIDITLPKLVKRDKCVCQLCGKLIDYDDFTIDDNGHFVVGDNYPSIDHIIPLSKGGRHRWDNVQLAHHRCNWLKGNSLEDKGA